MKSSALMSQTEEIIKKINLQHIAIIMDGNRRWAKNKALPTASGHKQGVDSLKKIALSCGKLGIKYLTVYAFSTENWNRTPSEVSFLMKLLSETIKKEFNELHEKNVRLRIIGDLTKFDTKLKKNLDDIVEKTSQNTGLNLQVAINYGSRDELKNAVCKIAQDIENAKISSKDISEELISNYLYTSTIPDPDLLIRTGGEQRLSNYLLWQMAYTELYITEKLWPEFDENALEDAIKIFAHRNRRFGGD